MTLVMAAGTMTGGSSSQVRVTEVTKVKPQQPQLAGDGSKTAPSVLPLTRFDIFMFPILPPVERLFFYDVPGITRDSFNSVILRDLKRSLSLALIHYLPLAGNIMWPADAEKPAVYFFHDDDQNDGVSFTVAESSADFNLLSGNGIHNAIELRPLVPDLSMTDDRAEVVSIKITLFPNQGYTIGITNSHAVLDGRSSTLFVKSWAHICKQLQSSRDEEQEQERYLSLSASLPPELTPFFDRSAVVDRPGGDVPSLKDLARPRSVDMNNLVRITIELTREDINELRGKITSEMERSSSNKQLHLSTFVVTLAHAFVCVVKAKLQHQEFSDNNKDCVILFVADYRARLDPPFPANYVGNCIKAHGDSAKARDVLQENGGLAFAAEMISDLVRGVSDDDGLRLLDPKMERIIELVEVEWGLTLTVAGSTRFGVYESDFGWGRPKKVEIVSIDRTGAVSFAESKDGGGGGVQLGCVLEKRQMEVFASSFADGLRK